MGGFLIGLSRGELNRVLGEQPGLREECVGPGLRVRVAVTDCFADCFSSQKCRSAGSQAAEFGD